MKVAPLNDRCIVQRVQEVLDYYPETGQFVWHSPPHNHPRLMGQLAGGKSSGYTMIKIDGQKYKAHRLAWLVMTGEWPDHRIDHINGDTHDNAWSNLRACDQTQNNANRKKNTGKALPKGVRQVGSRFQARLRSGGQLFSLGSFSTAEAAHAAYMAKAREVFGGFARAG